MASLTAAAPFASAAVSPAIAMIVAAATAFAPLAAVALATAAAVALARCILAASGFIWLASRLLLPGFAAASVFGDLLLGFAAASFLVSVYTFFPNVPSVFCL